MRNKFLSTSIILSVCVFIFLFGGFFQSKINNSVEAKSSAEQTSNFHEDLNTAHDYWVHNKLGSSYYRNGEYGKSIDEYEKAIQIIESAPDEYLRTDVSEEYKDGVNHELKVNSQIFSRYGLIDSLEKAGRYEEAIRNIDWLKQNQIVKGKEALLKQKLGEMKQSILQKMNGRHE